MPVNQETRPMRRLPDSSPRIPHKLRFPILFILSIDFSLAVLIAVVYVFAPLSPTIPAGSPLQPENTPRTIQTIVLPTPPRSATAYSAPVAAAPTAKAHWSAPAASKPPATRSAPSSPAPAHSSPSPVPTPRVTLSPRETPSPAPGTQTPDPTGSG